jgi:hypothetical protein
VSEWARLAIGIFHPNGFTLILTCATLLIGVWLVKLKWVLENSPPLAGIATQATAAPEATIGVIVPAYNEAANVVACLSSILDSTDQPIQLWLVDDGCTDATWHLAQTLAETRQDRRLHLLSGQPRPSDQVWVGKNWACAQAVQQVHTDYLLFLDCDVRLQPGAIEAAVALAETDQTGLLTLWPQILCGCFAEWLVQPIMMAILAVGYDFAAVNDPQRSKAFAFGPFMLFRRQAYEAIGGHAAVADQVVEDVQLAQRIKQAGLGLAIRRSGGGVQTRMYENGSSLWEGWTKNWFLGLGQRWEWVLITVAGLLLVCSLPWLGAISSTLTRDPLWFSLSLAGILGQLGMRWILDQQTQLPLKYWWLTGVGGLVTAAIVLASAYRTSTGKGWTWRGRSLSSASRHS